MIRKTFGKILGALLVSTGILGMLSVPTNGTSEALAHVGIQDYSLCYNLTHCKACVQPNSCILTPAFVCATDGTGNDGCTQQNLRGTCSRTLNILDNCFFASQKCGNFHKRQCDMFVNTEGNWDCRPSVNGCQSVPGIPVLCDGC